MSSEQRKVLAGMAAAVVFSAAFFEVMFQSTAIGLTPPGGIDTSWRLAYALKWEVIAALCLLAGVGKIANRRFFIPEAIDGARRLQSKSTGAISRTRSSSWCWRSSRTWHWSR